MDRLARLAALAGLLALTAAAPAAADVVYETNRCIGGDCGYKVMRVAADGSGAEKRLTFNFCGAGDPDWSPDGARIAFRRSDRPSPGAACTLDGDIWTMNPDGGALFRVTSGGMDDAPDWSPDGTRIVFSSKRDASVGEEIYVVGAAGGPVTRLTNDKQESFDPHFTPDGKRIVFSRDRAKGATDVWTMAADGSGETRLSLGGLLSGIFAQYSPDGAQIAFSEDQETIYTIRSDGTGLKARTGAEGGSRPAWSRDSKSLVFDAITQREPDLVNNLVRLDLGSGSRTQLTKDTKTLDQNLNADWWEPGAPPTGSKKKDKLAPVVSLVGSRGFEAPATLRPSSQSSASASGKRSVKSKRKSLGLAVLDRSGIRKVEVALAVKDGGKCRWLDSGADPGDAAKCSRPRFIRVKDGKAFRRIAKKLAKGSYRVVFRTRDRLGNRGVTPAGTLRITG